MFYYGIDYTYIILVLPAMLLALIAQAAVKGAFNKYSQVFSARNITAAQAARAVLDSNGLQTVRIERVTGELTDHYDPSANVIRLSQGVHDSTSTAAIGIACHECGHAIQHATDYYPIKLRSALVPITNFGSKIAVPLIIIGIILCYASYELAFIAYIGVACFALSTVFQLVTLPTELDASRRALNSIRSCNLLYDDEIPGARSVLRAAAWTYVAALAVSLAQLLRFLLLVSSASGRRRR